MIIVLIIIFVAIIIYQDRCSEKLKEENTKLKKRIKELEKGIQNQKTKENIITPESVFNNTTKEEKPLTEIKNVEKVKKETPVSDKKAKVDNEQKKMEQKNIGILITGSVCIVLAAIVFLASSWNIISDIVKIIVLVLLDVVFFYMSMLAKDKYELKKTSDTFFYIGMAYIPICLLAILFFGLFVDFFSLEFNKKMLYVGGTSLITSIIYFFYYKRRNTDGLLYGSIVAQVTTVILFSLIFEKSLKLIIIGILLYNIVLAVLELSKKENPILFIKYLVYGIAYLSIIFTFKIFDTSKKDVLLPLILCIINLFIIRIIYKKDKVTIWTSNLLVYVLGIYTPFVFFDILNLDFKIILSVLYIISVFVIFEVLFTDSENKISSLIYAMISIALLAVYSKINIQGTVKPYMLGIVEEVLAIYAYIKTSENIKRAMSIIIPVLLYLIIFDICLKMSYLINLAIPICILILGELLSFDNLEYKDIKKKFFIVSHVFIPIIWLFMFVNNSKQMEDDVLYYIALCIVYFYSFLKTKLPVFKYCGYLTLIMTSFSTGKLFHISTDFYDLLPIFVFVIVLTLEAKVGRFKDNYSKLTMCVVSIIAYGLLYKIKLFSSNHVNIFALMIGVLFSIYTYILFILNGDENSKYFKIIPLLGVGIVLYSVNSDAFTIILKIITVAVLTLYAIYDKKISIETIFSGVYLLGLFRDFDNFYVQIGILNIWVVVNMISVVNAKEKDIFKAILYFIAYILYSHLLEDLKFDEYASLRFIGIITTLTLIWKTILCKYTKETDLIEYILYGLIYFTAITQYYGMADGMIFGIFLALFIIFTYNVGYGAIFITTLIALIVNVLLLTRGFWFLIPWYIYLLVIGSILIGFAVKNEMNEKEDKIEIVNKFKNLKDNIDSNSKKDK